MVVRSDQKFCTGKLNWLRNILDKMFWILKSEMIKTISVSIV